MLSGKGYDKIYNLSGGIKAWGKEVAVGPEFTGLHLFPEEISAEDAIITGSLEMGLRDFYLSMQSKVTRETTRELFGKLADEERSHIARLSDYIDQQQDLV